MSEFDRQVAEALGYTLIPPARSQITNAGDVFLPPSTGNLPVLFSPSTNWSQAGELMEKYKISVEWFDGFGEWCGCVEGSDKTCYEATPQEAVCRAIVASMENKG